MDDERYDFADFLLGDDVENALGGPGRQAVRELLANSFAAFGDEGAWWIESDGAIRWSPDWKKGSPFWEFEFPVQIVLRPVDVARMIADQIETIVYETGKPLPACERDALLAGIAKWRTALDAAEADLRALPVDP